jgi:hypothetical protein
MSTYSLIPAEAGLPLSFSRFRACDELNKNGFTAKAEIPPKIKQIWTPAFAEEQAIS